MCLEFVLRYQTLSGLKVRYMSECFTKWASSITVSRSNNKNPVIDNNITDLTARTLSDENNT